MKRKLLLTFTIITALLYMAGPSLAAGKGKKSTKKAASAPKQPDAPFNIDTEKVSLDKTNNVLGIYAALVKNSDTFRKNELETTADFKKRIIELRGKAITKNLKYGDTVAFIQMSDTNDKYDADQQKMSISLSGSKNIYDYDLKNSLEYEVTAPKEGYPKHKVYPIALDIFINSHGKKGLPGRNAFGAKIMMTSETCDIYAIVMPGDNRYLKDWQSNEKLVFPLTSDKAAQAKKWGALLFVGRLVPPFVGKGRDFSSATIDYPAELISLYNYIALELQEIWYFNKNNGEVFHKAKITMPEGYDSGFLQRGILPNRGVSP